MKIPHYVNGEWLDRDDPMPELFSDSGKDWGEIFKEAGYERWCTLGDDKLAGTPVSIGVYARADYPRFCFEIGGAAGQRWEVAYAGAISDAMALLAQWAPIVQSGALVELVQRFNLSDPELHKATASLVRHASSTR